MKNPSPITGREIWKITLCLTVTCALAAAVLGAVFYFTEPAKQANMAVREISAVRRLLDLSADAKIIEVRRYIDLKGEVVGYLLSDALQEYDTQGNFLKKIPKPASLLNAPGEVSDAWVEKEFLDSHFVGRFFMARSASGKEAGFVTESSQYGFKSAIRFFVALSPDFQIRGVEVISHEEDPGLGAEIAKPLFKDQFVGLRPDDLLTLKLLKGPKPKEVPLPEKEKQIYAVTGATISSKALVDGVRQAVQHLERRLQIVEGKRGAR